MCVLETWTQQSHSLPLQSHPALFVLSDTAAMMNATTNANTKLLLIAMMSWPECCKLGEFINCQRWCEWTPPGCE